MNITKYFIKIFHNIICLINKIMGLTHGTMDKIHKKRSAKRQTPF